MKNKEKIINYLQQRYLFHGSSVSGLQTLEPRLATDSDDSNTWNQDDAVSAIAFAVIRSIQAAYGHMD